MPADKNEDQAKPETRNKIKKTVLLIVTLFLFQIVVSYFIVYKVVKPKIIQKSSALNISQQSKTSIGEIYIIKDIVVNPRETGGRRFINISLGLDCNSSKTIKEVGKQDIKIRDYLISLFSNRSIEELDDESDKDILREKIKNDVNKFMKGGGIQAVYFTNYILN